MRPGAALLAPLALLLVLLAGCSGGFPVPPGALITCGSDADCPGGFICRSTLGRCVRPGGDATPPQLLASSLVITPARVGTATALVSVAFQVSEPLAADPVAALRLSGPGGVTRPLTLLSRDDATLRYVMTYAPSPATDGEGDVSLVATLVDLAGNQAQIELPHVAVFDFTPPGLALDQGGAPISAVTLTPPATSPRRDVTAVTAGTRLRAEFASDEPLAGGADSPVVTLGSGAGAVTLTELSGNGLSFAYEVVVAPGLPEGPAPLMAHLTDLAGNVADVSLGTVEVKMQPPASPAVATPDAVLFHRLPWGSDATAGAEAFYLRGAAGSVPPGALAIAYSDPTVVTSDGRLVGREIARVAADGTGAFGGDVGDPAPFQLFMGDSPDVYVAAVDSAGNVSDADGDPSNGVQAALVRDVAWTATMLGKIPGRVFPNPHAFEARQVWTETLAQRGSKPIPDPADVGLVDGASASVRGAPHWLPARSYGALGDRSGLALAHDPVRDCRVSFGGVGWDGCDGGSFCDQWESCRGRPWARITPQDPEGDGNPGLSTDLPMVFAGGRGVVVLSDGTDLWEWDGTSWRRIVMSDPEGDGNPAPRQDHAIAYDEARQRLVLFGGQPKGGGAPLRDTWETDFHSWTRVCATAPCSATLPPARSLHRMVYDPARKVTLLVGGNLASGYDPATWTWNGSAWTPGCSTGACATAAQRSGHGLAFDPGRGKAVLFGGTTAGGTDGGLFEWDGSAWTAACTTSPCNVTTPIARTGMALYWDVTRARVVLSNGFSGAGFGSGECPGNWCGTEWEWDGAAWTQIVPTPAGPPNVGGVTPVYDPLRDRVVLFGGFTGSGTYGSATWLWDGSKWAAGSPTTIPAGRSQYAAAYVATGTLFPGGYVAMATGTNGSVMFSPYAWSGTDWSAAGSSGPSARTASAMAQSVRARIITGGGGALLFGGADGSGTALCDTWELSGGAWTNLAGCSASNPSARWGHAMVRALGFPGSPVVLVGGAAGSATTVLNDVWTFTGSWTLVSAGGPGSATQPVPRQGHGLFYDPARNRVILWGGGPAAAVSAVNCVDDYGGLVCHDFWEWSGSAWTRVFPVDLYGDANPDPYHLEGIAFDTSRRAGVGVVSTSGTNPMDTWWWYGGSEDRPGHVMSVVFDAAEVQRPFDVLDLDVRWVGGASGAPGGAATPGASVRIWDNTGWRQLVSSATASPAAPETLHWSLSSDPGLSTIPNAERQRFMVGDQRVLYLGFVPAAASGSADGFGEARTDYAEVTVRYRVTGP